MLQQSMMENILHRFYCIRRKFGETFRFDGCTFELDHRPQCASRAELRPIHHSIGSFCVRRIWEIVSSSSCEMFTPNGTLPFSLDLLHSHSCWSVDMRHVAPQTFVMVMVILYVCEMAPSPWILLLQVAFVLRSTSFSFLGFWLLYDIIPEWS